MGLPNSEGSSRPGPSKPIYRYVRFWLVIVVIAGVIIGPVLAYYEMSFNSVNGTILELNTGRRGCTPNAFDSSTYDSVTFYLEVHVWSYATSVTTHLQDPTFMLGVDSFSLGSTDQASGTFDPGGSQAYFLRFDNKDPGAATAICQSKSNYLLLSMSAVLDAGIFQEQLSRSGWASWNWS